MKLLKEKRANVESRDTDRWFGVTYKEDKEIVQKAAELDSEWNLWKKLWE